MKPGVVDLGLSFYKDFYLIAQVLEDPEAFSPVLIVPQFCIDNWAICLEELFASLEDELLKILHINLDGVDGGGKVRSHLVQGFYRNGILLSFIEVCDRFMHNMAEPLHSHRFYLRHYHF